MTFQALPGFRDFGPEALAFRSHLLEAWRRVANRYGFQEYDGPPLEPLELYTAKSGEEIVGQLFEFVDKGGRQVALRPEMTPTFARMVSQHANGMRKPIRWFSVPQLFRYERQQRGRLREHFQLNCDLVGEAGPLADTEVIALAIDVCRELGLTSEDFRVRLSDRSVLQAIFASAGIDGPQFDAVLGAIDKLERAGREATIARLAELGVAPPQVDLILRTAAVRSREELAALATSCSVSTAEWGFLKVVDALEAMGLGDFVEIDLSIVRGLAYYTGTVFELFDRKGELRAICGGGRYDTLLSSLGGVDLPAVGFGMGDVVLGELLKDRGLAPTPPLQGVTVSDLPNVLAVAHQLRDAGIAVEYALGGGALSKQLKLADARGARMAVLVGPNDWLRGDVQLKDLVQTSQDAVPLDRLVERCRALLTRTG
jgi:histidyl-tRNA synthetase